MERSVLAVDDSFLSQSMRIVYSEVLQIKGRGAPRTRMDTLERKVAAYNGIWRKVHDGIDLAFDKLCASLEATIIKKIGGIYDNILNNFHLLCDGTETKNEENRAMEEILREKLKENLQEVKRMLDHGGDISKLVKQCRSYHSPGNAGATQLSLQ